MYSYRFHVADYDHLHKMWERLAMEQGIEEYYNYEWNASNSAV